MLVEGVAVGKRYRDAIDTFVFDLFEFQVDFVFVELASDVEAITGCAVDDSPAS